MATPPTSGFEEHPLAELIARVRGGCQPRIPARIRVHKPRCDCLGLRSCHDRLAPGVVLATDKPKPYESRSSDISGLRTGWVSVVPVRSSGVNFEVAALNAFISAGGANDIQLQLSNCCLADEGNGCVFLIGRGLPLLLARMAPTGNDDIACVFAVPMADLIAAAAIEARTCVSSRGFPLGALPQLAATVAAACHLCAGADSRESGSPAIGSAPESCPGTRVRLGHHLATAVAAPWAARVPPSESVLCILHDYGPGEPLVLDVPGGRRCPGEAAAAAALRELTEETGLRAVLSTPPQDGRLLGLAGAVAYEPNLPAGYRVADAPVALLEVWRSSVASSRIGHPQQSSSFTTIVFGLLS